MNVLGFSGSLRRESSNTRLLQVAMALAPAGLDITLANTLGELPHFSPDTAVESVPVVNGFVAEVRSCDGILVSSPVYAGGYPGTLKNALDWLVGTDAFIGKPFAFLSASNRVPAVQASLRVVLETMGGIHVPDATTLVPILGKKLETVELMADRSYSRAIESALVAYQAYLETRNEET